MTQYFLQQKIKFSAIDDFTGQEIEREGIIVGYGDSVRKKWPEEMGEADDSMFLVKVQMPMREIYFAVAENEVLRIIKEQHDDECDCITCRARVEKGGLDYDPTSDDEEFEEHERQVMRDTGINKEEK
jgi:hypothetical protein